MARVEARGTMMTTAARNPHERQIICIASSPARSKLRVLSSCRSRSAAPPERNLERCGESARGLVQPAHPLTAIPYMPAPFSLTRPCTSAGDRSRPRIRRIPHRERPRVPVPLSAADHNGAWECDTTGGHTREGDATDETDVGKAQGRTAQEEANRAELQRA
jgi:hypothetical protein